MTLDIAINSMLTDSYLSAMKWNAWEIHLKNFMADILITLGSIRSQWKIWWLIRSLTSLMQWYNWFWVVFFLYWFCHLDCHFSSIDASCDGCHAWGRQCLLNPEHLVVLSAGPISHNSIHLLIITTDFVALYWFTGYVVFIITLFLAGVESRDQWLLNSKVLSCFSGVIMSIRSFSLLSWWSTTTTLGRSGQQQLWLLESRN